jgi:hypothetical protein
MSLNMPASQACLARVRKIQSDFQDLLKSQEWATLKETLREMRIHKTLAALADTADTSLWSLEDYMKYLNGDLSIAGIVMTRLRRDTTTSDDSS